MLIALLTDFGLSDPFVGVMKAVIASIAPEAAVIDLTHGIPARDIAAGAWALATATPYLPPDAVVVGVVDPGVGTARRPVGARLGRHIFVGPDNGLISWWQTREPLTAAIVLDRRDLWLSEQPSATFHGRDLFAPVAAHIVHGVPLADAGSAIDPASLVRLDLPTPVVRGKEIAAHIISVDRFGNLITDIGPDLAARLFSAIAISARLGRHRIAGRAATFGAGPASAPFWYLDSSGHAAIAWRSDSAARRLNAEVGMIISVRLEREP
jgi:S-adenosylmethionine hydrolase